MNATDASKLQLLRLRIESQTHAPAVIVVTSAQEHDGKSLAARGLAQCLAAAGHRVALVDVHLEPLATRAGQAPSPRLAAPFKIVTLSIGEEDPPLSRDAVGSLVQTLRATYDYTLVDAGVLMTSSVALLFAAAADAVLLAVRHGRAPVAADAVMIQTLKHLQARTLGVVAASAESISAFNLSAVAGAEKAARFAAHRAGLDAPSGAPLLAQ